MAALPLIGLTTRPRAVPRGPTDPDQQRRRGRRATYSWPRPRAGATVMAPPNARYRVALAVTPTAHWLDYVDIAGAVLTERLLPRNGMVTPRGPAPDLAHRRIRRRSVLGGLLNEYERTA